MSIRTAEPGSAAADEPERRTGLVGDDLAPPSPLPVPDRVDVETEPATEPVQAQPLDVEPSAAKTSATLSEQPAGPTAEIAADEQPVGGTSAVEVSAAEVSTTGADAGGSDVAVATGEVVVPEAPAAQDPAPTAPTTDVAPRSTSIAAPAPLGAEHDDAALETAAGGSGSGAGSGGTTTGGSGRGRKPKKDPEGRMALREHLTELRKRVVRAGIFVLLGAIAGWFLYGPVIDYMTQPLQDLRAEDGSRLISINFNNVGASFDLKLKGAVWIGFIVSSPFWIYQLWAFITPGLTKKERRYAIGFVSAAVPLFLGGVYLASLFIPRAVAFLTSFTPDGATNLTDAPSYIGFILRTVLTFGLAFLLPVVLVALNFSGLLPGATILKAWRWVLVACFTFAAIATPTPDVIAMFTLAAPIIILFALAIVIALLHDRRKAKRSPSYAGISDDDASNLGDDEAAPL